MTWENCKDPKGNFSLKMKSCLIEFFTGGLNLHACKYIRAKIVDFSFANEKSLD